jgi:hypothetical protein
VNEWGDFELGEVEFDFQPGHTVRVTSDDDPPVQKVHTITALQMTEVNPAADTVAGTTDSGEGSIVEVFLEDFSALRYPEVQADGSWLADFSVAVDDGGGGWGQPFDIVAGTRGGAREQDDDNDGTWIEWNATADLPPCTEAPFTDVGIDHPFCAEIAWMKDQGISTGFTDGTYRPSIAVTRMAMSAFMYRVSLLLP